MLRSENVRALVSYIDMLNCMHVEGTGELEMRVRDITGHNPMIWMNQENRILCYQTMYSKLLLAFFLSSSVVSEELRESLRKIELVPLQNFGKDADYGLIVALERIFLDIALEKEIWEVRHENLDLNMAFREIVRNDLVYEEKGGHLLYDAILEELPEDVMKALELSEDDYDCFGHSVWNLAEDMGIGADQDLTLVMWESSVLYQALNASGTPFSSYRVRELVDRVARQLVKGYYATADFQMWYLDHDRKKLVIVFMETDVSFHYEEGTEIVPPFGAYNFSALWDLEELVEGHSDYIRACEDGGAA